jgi:hypothetical protein
VELCGTIKKPKEKIYLSKDSITIACYSGETVELAFYAKK